MSTVVGGPKSSCSQSVAFGEPRVPQIGFVATYAPDVTGRPLVVEPSTACAGSVAWEAGLVVVNDAVAVAPRARFVVAPAASAAG